MKISTRLISLGESESPDKRDSVVHRHLSQLTLAFRLPQPGLIALLTNSACLCCTLGSANEQSSPTLSSGVPTFLYGLGRSDDVDDSRNQEHLSCYCKSCKVDELVEANDCEKAMHVLSFP